MIDDNRIGRMEVTNELLSEAPTLWDYIGGEILEQHIGERYGTTVFTMKHEAFEALQDGDVIPYYTAYLEKGAEGQVKVQSIIRVK